MLRHRFNRNIIGLIIAIGFCLAGCDTRVLPLAIYRIDRIEDPARLLSDLEDHMERLGFLKSPSITGSNFKVGENRLDLIEVFNKTDELFVYIYRPIDMTGLFLMVSVADKKENRYRGCPETESTFLWLNNRVDMRVYIWGKSCIYFHEVKCFCVNS